MRTSSCTFALLATLVTTGSSGGAEADQTVAGLEIGQDIEQCWRDEFKQLQEEIDAGNTFGKRQRSRLPMLDDHVLVWDSDKDALGVILRRTQALLDDIARMPTAPDMQPYARRFELLKQQVRRFRAGQLGEKEASVSDARERLFLDVAGLRRQIALSNPLLDFDQILFVSRKRAHRGIIQGNSAYAPVPGGGLYVVSGIKSSRSTIRNLLEGSKVQNGPLKGQSIHDRPQRSFQGPELSYDGNAIVFSYTDLSNKVDLPCEVYNGTHCAMHIFKVNIDGSGLTQLTDGIWKDYSPCWLPNDRIVFISERREMTNRCSGLRNYEAAATMYSIAADGSDLHLISWHEVDELHPSVDNSGMLVYTRWDYVDRDFSAAHHIWRCYPDGRDPRAPHGNYAKPHHTFEGERWPDGRANRPWAEQYIRSVPSAAGKYLAVATGHHRPASGPLILIDTTIPDDNEMSQVKVISGTGRLPGDQSPGGGPEYISPWPLCESYYIAAELGGSRGTSGEKHVLLVDRFGNRELLFRARVNQPVQDPIPLRARRAPPELPTQTFQGERCDSPGHKRAVISLINVYDSDFEWPPDTKITALRIIEIFPRTWLYPDNNQPRTGYGDGSNARMVLGTVPVEDDGSAYFEAPVGKAIYFQAVDQHGLAVQSMRSCTYVHPGEHLSCAGCHEKKWRAPAPQSVVPIALRRAPSKITPEVEGSMPFSFARLVQPVIESNCLPCHEQHRDNSRAITKMGYRDLEQWSFYFHGEGASKGLTADHGGYRTIAGRFGARQSSLFKHLEELRAGGELTIDEFHRFTLWQDCNSNELGAHWKKDEQQRGEVVWPMPVDPRNPTGVEHSRPLR